MGEHTPHITAPFDPILLGKPFEVQTNWVTITGTSCSGKTTIINQLAALGFQTVPEVARAYFDAEILKGRTIEEIRSDLTAVEKVIMDRQIECEEGLCSDDVVFLDRSLPDILTFFRFAGISPNDYLSHCFRYRYAGVYVLDPFQLERDGLRIEGEELRVFLDTWLPRDYSAVGYDVVRVPVMLPEERLAFLLGDLAQKGVIKD